MTTPTPDGPVPDPGPPCRHRSCGHPRHGHLRDGPCVTSSVSGPAVDNDRQRLSSADQHAGRTVVACQCQGYLS